MTKKILFLPIYRAVSFISFDDVRCSLVGDPLVAWKRVKETTMMKIQILLSIFVSIFLILVKSQFTEFVELYSNWGGWHQSLKSKCVIHIFKKNYIARFFYQVII